MEVKFHAFLTLELDGVYGQLHTLVSLLSRKKLPVLLYRIVGRPRAGFDMVARRKIPATAGN